MPASSGSTKLNCPTLRLKILADSGEFASLDAKLAAGIARVAQGDLGRATSTAKERFALKGVFVKEAPGLEDDI